jgi:hypothetical protein
MHCLRFPASSSVFAPPRPLKWLTTVFLLAAVIVVPIAGAQSPAVKQDPAVPLTKSITAPDATALSLDKKIITEAKSGSEIMRNLAYLSDIIGPRLTGSPALKQANEWTAEKMKSYGLTNVHLEAWSIPVGWERGTATARIIEPSNGRPLTVAAMGWTPGTNGKIVGDVVVLTAKNKDELAAYKGKLKNAIVLRSPPREIAPVTDTRYLMGGGRRQGVGPGTPPGQNPNAPGGTPPGRFSRSDGQFGERMALMREMSEFLRTEGVAVMLQDAGKPHGLLTTSGGWRGMDRASAADPLPSLTMAHEHYALLYRLATRPAPARTRVEIEITNKLIPGPIPVYNTIGEIRGTEKPDEFVVVGAHLDSWDLAQGTTDNGTGSSIVLEAARILSHCGIKPKRTIRFALFTGEEQGLHGSKAYVQQHKDELPRTSMCLVHDTGTGKVVGLGLQGRQVIKPILDAELTSLKELGLADINLRGMGGSDHMSFEQAGVPGFAFQQDMAEYRFTHHSQSDTLDKAREPDLIQGAQMMAVIAMRVANLPNLLPRDKPERSTRNN